MNSKLKVLLSFAAMSFVMIGCGGSGSSGDTGGNNGEVLPTTNIVQEEDIGNFLHASYASKDRYETTDEYNQRMSSTLDKIKDTTFLLDGGGFAYDADSGTGTTSVRFSHTFDQHIPDIANKGISYEVNYTKSSGTILGESYQYNNYYEYVFSNLNSPDSLVSTLGSSYCEYISYPTGAIKCEIEFSSSPEEAQNIDLGIKLAVDITSMEVEEKGWKNYGGINFEFSYYPSNFRSLVLYDKNSGKELGKMILR